MAGKGWSKQQVLNMVQWVLQNGYMKQGGRIYKQTRGFKMAFKCALFLANLGSCGKEKRYAEQEGRKGGGGGTQLPGC